MRRRQEEMMPLGCGRRAATARAGALAILTILVGVPALEQSPPVAEARSAPGSLVVVATDCPPGYDGARYATDCGTPRAGVRFSLAGPVGRDGATGTDGRIEFRELPPGAYTLRELDLDPTAGHLVSCSTHATQGRASRAGPAPPPLVPLAEGGHPVEVVDGGGEAAVVTSCRVFAIPDGAGLPVRGLVFVRNRYCYPAASFELRAGAAAPAGEGAGVDDLASCTATRPGAFTLVPAEGGESIPIVGDDGVVADAAVAVPAGDYTITADESGATARVTVEPGLPASVVADNPGALVTVVSQACPGIDEVTIAVRDPTAEPPAEPLADAGCLLTGREVEAVDETIGAPLAARFTVGGSYAESVGPGPYTVTDVASGVSAALALDLGQAATAVVTAPTPGETGTLAFAATDWEGAYAGVDTTFYGRDAVALYGAESGLGAAELRFTLDAVPAAGATLTIAGLDDEDAPPTPLAISLNGVPLSRGDGLFPMWDPAAATPAWGEATFELAHLVVGENVIRVANLTPSGAVGRPPYVLLAESTVVLGPPPAGP